MAGAKPYPSRVKEARQAAWRKWKRKVSKGALAHFHKCLCGETAHRYRNGWVCERCDSLEKDHHRYETSGHGRSYADHVFTIRLSNINNYD